MTERQNIIYQLIKENGAVTVAELVKKFSVSDETVRRDLKQLEERIKEAKINFKKAEVENKIILHEGDAVEILPTLEPGYDIVFIDAAKSKYSIFLEEGIRLINDEGIILADNVLYKGHVMSDYNKHKQRTAVRHLREYIKEVTENPNLETEILEIGDGLAITRVKK